MLLGGYARAHSQVGVSVGLVKQAWINRSRHCVWSIEYACVRSLAGGWVGLERIWFGRVRGVDLDPGVSNVCSRKGLRAHEGDVGKGLPHIHG